MAIGMLKNRAYFYKRFIFFITLFAGSLLYGELPKAFIRKALTRFVNANHIQGLAAAVYYDGRPYFFNLGYSHPRSRIKVTEHTIFDIASISKSFTATLLALAVQRGHMKLNASIPDYVPFVRNHPSALNHITLSQLATHTSGLPRRAPIRRKNAQKREILRSLLGWRPEYPIGTKFKYSNVGYTILGYTLENVYQMPYEALVIQQIARPLGMSSTFVHIPPALIPNYAQGFSRNNEPVRRNRVEGYQASGGLRSTSADLMKFLRANIGDYGPKKLQDAMKLAQKGIFKANPHMVQGLGWQNFTKEGIELIDKNGGLPGFSSWLGWVPKSPSKKGPVGLILLSNTRCAKLTGFGRKLVSQLARR